ncbi:MAG: TRAP transporter substrate-binding protein [Defluviitaleaceae bacterium]|nr:TRAP transporter substrate-binding protein [Defluviitaleaceae bacterium]
MKKLFRTVPALILATALLGACTAPDGGAASAQPPAQPAANGGTADASPAPADPGEVFNLTFAHVVSASHPMGIASTRFAELLEERTGGRIVVTVFPDSQLGNDQEVLEQMMLDVIHFNAPLHSVLTSIIPEFEMFDLPYLFYSMDDAYRVLHGALGDRFKEFLAESNLVSLGYWTGGFKQLTNNVRPIHSVEDLDGLQMRVSQSPMLISQFRAINAGAISIPFVELYTALQTGIADGQENPLSNIVTRRFYEVQNYITISNHGFFVYPFFMPAATYDRLPEDLRRIIHEVAQEVAEFQWELTAATDDEYLEYLYNAGVNINYFTEEAMRGFRAATQVTYDEFAESPNGAELLEILGRYTY